MWFLDMDICIRRFLSNQSSRAAMAIWRQVGETSTAKFKWVQEGLDTQDNTVHFKRNIVALVFLNMMETHGGSHEEVDNLPKIRRHPGCCDRLPSIPSAASCSSHSTVFTNHIT